MVESTGNKILLKVGTGRVYPFPVRFIDASDVHCFVNVNGVERELVASEFSVERKDDYSDGANITLNIDPLPTGATLAIVRQCDPVQLVSFPINGKFPSKGNENALDKLTMIVQDLYERLNRAIAGSVTDSNAVISYDEFKKFLDQAVTDSASAKNLVEKWLERFAGLTADSTGRLFWKGCEVLTRCNIGDIGGGGGGSDGEDGSGGSDGSDGEDGSGGSDGSDGEDGEDGKDGRPGEIIEAEGDTSKGYVRIIGYERILDFKAIPNAIIDHGDEECKAEYYYNRLLVHDGQPYAFDRLHHQLVAVQGNVFEEEDENGEPVYYCELPEGPYYNQDTKKIEFYDAENDETRTLTVDVEQAIVDINASLDGIIDGEIHSEDAEPEAPAAFPAAGWTGYRWYRPYTESSWVGQLEKSGDLAGTGTRQYLGYYSNWGGYPCDVSQESVSGSLSIDTYIFEWVPAEDYDGPPPQKLLLIDELGYRKAYDFGVEYCLTGLDYVDRDWFRMVSCDPGTDDWVLPFGTEPSANIKKDVSFTYEGVLF